MKLFSHPKLIACLILITITSALFLPSLRYDFTPIDDNIYVYDNSNVKQGLNFRTVHWALTSLQNSYWIPVTRLSYLLDTTLFGVTPVGYRATNILFHIFNTLLLLHLLHKTTRSLIPSTVVAALFAIHPLRVESVVWITERKDVLCTFWSLLSILCYVSWNRQTGRKRWVIYGASLFCFLISLSAKPLWITLPAVLLLLDVWPLKQINRFGTNGSNPFRKYSWLIPNKIPYAVFSLFFVCSTLFSQRKVIYSEPSGYWTTHIPLVVTNYFFYIRKTIFPSKLSIEYPFQTSFCSLGWGFTLLFLSAVTVLALLSIRKRGFLFTGWFWYLITILPIIGFIQVGSVRHADRFSYVPAIGLYVLFAWGCRHVVRGHKKLLPLMFLFLAGIITALSLTTSRYMKTWETGEKLLTRAVKTNGGNYVTCIMLGLLCKNQGLLEDAEKYTRLGLSKRMDYHGFNNLAIILLDKNQPGQALQLLMMAKQLSTDNNPQVYINLGIAYGQLGDGDKALEMFITGCDLNPEYQTCGLYLINKGFFEQAESFYRHILQEKLEDSFARNGVLISLARQKMFDQAFTFAETTFPDSRERGQALTVAARTLIGQKDWVSVSLFAEKAQSLLMDDMLPKLYAALADLKLERKLREDPLIAGIAYIQQFPENAEGCNLFLGMLPHLVAAPQTPARIEMVLKESLHEKELRKKISWVLSVTETTPPDLKQRAKEIVAQVAQEHPNDPDVLDTLAAAYAATGDFREAARIQQHALRRLVKPSLEMEKRLQLYQSGQPYLETK